MSNNPLPSKISPLDVPRRQPPLPPLQNGTQTEENQLQQLTEEEKETELLETTPDTTSDNPPPETTNTEKNQATFNSNNMQPSTEVKKERVGVVRNSQPSTAQPSTEIGTRKTAPETTNAPPAFDFIDDILQSQKNHNDRLSTMQKLLLKARDESKILDASHRERLHKEIYSHIKNLRPDDIEKLLTQCNIATENVQRITNSQRNINNSNDNITLCKEKLQTLSHKNYAHAIAITDQINIANNPSLRSSFRSGVSSKTKMKLSTGGAAAALATGLSTLIASSNGSLDDDFYMKRYSEIADFMDVFSGLGSLPVMSLVIMAICLAAIVFAAYTYINAEHESKQEDIENDKLAIKKAQETLTNPNASKEDRIKALNEIARIHKQYGKDPENTQKVIDDIQESISSIHGMEQAQSTLKANEDLIQQQMNNIVDNIVEESSNPEQSKRAIGREEGEGGEMSNTAEGSSNPAQSQATTPEELASNIPDSQKEDNHNNGEAPNNEDTTPDQPSPPISVSPTYSTSPPNTPSNTSQEASQGHAT